MQQDLPLNDPHALHGRFVSHLTRSTYAIILAGGRGSRLMQLTDWRSKPAVPFGGKFRILDFTLSNCVNSGIRRIGVATQYKAQSLIRHLQRGWSFLDGRFDEFIDLLPAQQQVGEDWYQGTADAVFQNIDLLRRNHPKYVLILSGDHIYKMDYGRMLAQHAQSEADLTIACMDVTLEEIKDFVTVQIGALQAVAALQGERLQHVKPHGALYNMAVKNPAIWDAVAEVMAALDLRLILFVLAGSDRGELEEIGRRHGIRIAFEFFADRAYNPDGSLVSRKLPGAVISDHEAVEVRVLKLVWEGRVTAVDGSDIDLKVETICVHGDNPNAVALAKKIRATLAAAQIAVAPPDSFL